MATKIKRKILNFGDFKKGKNTLEKAEKHPIKDESVKEAKKEKEEKDASIFGYHIMDFKKFKKGKDTVQKEKLKTVKEEAHPIPFSEPLVEFLKTLSNYLTIAPELNEMTQEARDFISKKIKYLVDEEGRPHDQAVAMAYSYARKEGYDVPEK